MAFSWRAASLRTQLSVTLVLLVVGLTGLLGYATYRSAREIISGDALRMVGAVAESRRVLLLQILGRQRDRLDVYLQVVTEGCSSAECRREHSRRLLGRERAEAVLLTMPGEPALALGPRELLEELPLPASDVIAQPFRDHRGGRWYAIRRGREDRSEVVVVWPAAHLDPLFAVGDELGEAGESFLTDADGFFITAQRYPSTAGHSHPIDASPMRACLSGENAAVVAPDYRDALVIHGFRFVPEIGGGCIMAHMDAAEAFAPVRRLARQTLAVASVFALGAIALAVLLAARVSRPLSQLARGAAAIRAGDHSFEIPPLEGPRELRELAARFGEMAGALRESDEVRERFIAILAHDLRNQLSVITAASAILREAELPPTMHGVAVRLSENAARMARMTSELLDFAKSRRREGIPIQPRHVDLGQLTTATVEDRRKVEPDRAIECRLAGDVSVRCDPDRAVQVVVNLLENALRYGSPDRAVTVTVAWHPLEVALRVHNWGPSIPPEDLASLFDPFRRGREREVGPPGGLGLGLYIVEQILRAHGGRVSVLSSEAEGTSFTTYWPR
jgi:signal transduction histidine kinase